MPIRASARTFPPVRHPLPATAEALEDRRLLSASVAESEPNDGPPAADALPRVPRETVHVSGAIGAAGDADWFTIDLKKGDVLGASVAGQNGLDGILALGNSAGELLVGNDDSFKNGAAFLPAESPLPRIAASIRDPEIYRVIDTTGTYYLRLTAFVDDETGETTTGAYNMDLVVARPAIEARPVGSRQIVFLDFDGGTVPLDPDYAPHLDNLATSLPDWGLKPTDLGPVIKETVRRVTDKLSTFVGANGLNGDYARSHIPGQFGIDIRNSRDDLDPSGINPLVSRIVVGKTDNARLAGQDIGAAEDIDVGNLKTDDQVAVSTNFITDIVGLRLSKPGQKSMVIDYVAEYLSVLIAHEFGHLAGAYHTQYSLDNVFNEPVNLMDKNIFVPLGPDGVFGTRDDITMQFGRDAYDPNEVYFGTEDTLNTVAFGLSTGTARAAPPVATAAPAGAVDSLGALVLGAAKRRESLVASTSE